MNTRRLVTSRYNRRRCHRSRRQNPAPGRGSRHTRSTSATSASTSCASYRPSWNARRLNALVDGMRTRGPDDGCRCALS